MKKMLTLVIHILFTVLFLMQIELHKNSWRNR